MKLQFRPPLWATLGSIPLLALFVFAGTWQLDKGRHKLALERAFQVRTEAPLELAVDSPAPDHASAPRARAAGHFDPTHQLLLDNQTRGQTPGYHVWTPLLLVAGGILLVDRGWVAADPHRETLPDLAVGGDPRSVSGFWRPLPEPGLRLGQDDCSKTFPRVVNYPTGADLSCILGARVAPGVLELDAAEPDGYVREWQQPSELPPSRHFGYAAQWYAFAGVLLFFYFRLNLKRTPR